MYLLLPKNLYIAHMHVVISTQRAYTHARAHEKLTYKHITCQDQETPSCDGAQNRRIFLVKEDTLLQ